MNCEKPFCKNFDSDSKNNCTRHPDDSDYCNDNDNPYFIDLNTHSEKIELKNDAGNKFDGNKNRLDLLSIQAMNGIAEVLTFGCKKYGDRNWEKGLSFSRVFGALLRHLFAWWIGKNNDDETGLNHLDHAACCLMFLQHFTKTKTGNDDRVIFNKEV
jgi:hypothetical protein